jgi:hypothetical protein
MSPLFKILSVFFTCSFAFKIGFPTAFMVLDQDFFTVITVTCAGGIAGNILFTHLSAALLKAIHEFRVKRGLIQKTKKFSPFNRRVIRIKQKFGLAGIAFVTPIFLSTPVGAFLAERFFKDKRKIIIYLSGATVLWAFLLYFILYFFHESLKGWLI